MKIFIFLGFLFLIYFGLVSAAVGEDYQNSIPHTSAIVNITFVDPLTGEERTEEEDMGLYGSESRLDSEWGWVVHVRTFDNRTHGCTPPVNVPADRWIALIERGSCKFHQKIHNAAIVMNASAVVIYNYESQPDLLQMKHKVDDVVSIFVRRRHGEQIASLVDNGTRVLMHIYVGRQWPNGHSSISRTSVLFVSISFIVLMVISLAWLVFYYVQRFRYAHTKDRLAKRLMNAAKKAVGRMPQKVLRRGDEETLPEFDLCAVCVESYKVAETVRILPCKHVFHKCCVDPWLIEQRSCPICKLDILQAYGIHVSTNCRDIYEPMVHSTELESPYMHIDATQLLLDDHTTESRSRRESTEAVVDISIGSSTSQQTVSMSQLSQDDE